MGINSRKVTIDYSLCSVRGAQTKRDQDDDDDDEPTMYSSKKPSKKLLAAMEQMEVSLCTEQHYRIIHFACYGLILIYVAL